MAPAWQVHAAIAGQLQHQRRQQSGDYQSYGQRAGIKHVGLSTPKPNVLTVEPAMDYFIFRPLAPNLPPNRYGGMLP
ncbi:hypothetical protein GCM10007907_39940 [Chitinimonas prasina]|uniref:Uncharacterized protein n=1 Tax=Chitinimonas prasina TaxID=1434937 RepID=A0ABQ5YKR9_9NEIS|nr:hypothetical protein GCM10007907_39940 [Chitinimonas prasina]